MWELLFSHLAYLNISWRLPGLLLRNFIENIIVLIYSRRMVVQELRNLVPVTIIGTYVNNRVSGFW